MNGKQCVFMCWMRVWERWRPSNLSVCMVLWIDLVELWLPLIVARFYLCSVMRFFLYAYEYFIVVFISALLYYLLFYHALSVCPVCFCPVHACFLVPHAFSFAYDHLAALCCCILFVIVILIRSTSFAFNTLPYNQQTSTTTSHGFSVFMQRTYD